MEKIKTKWIILLILIIIIGCDDVDVVIEEQTYSKQCTLNCSSGYTETSTDCDFSNYLSNNTDDCTVNVIEVQTGIIRKST